jgi:phenylalanyl-tRNA synthetase beta chain
LKGLRVAYKWLKDLVDIDLQPEVLGEQMTMAGIAVENVENMAKGLERVVVGQVTSMEKHADSNKLWVCQVNVGEESYQIVTGAQNVNTGDKLPVALEGAELPNGLVIKPTKLRGVPSNGMLCSIGELNLEPADWPEDSGDGILILPSEVPIGMQIAAYLGIDESVLELELYPNRADCLGMVNVAREVSAITGGKLHLPKWANGVNPELKATGVNPQVTICDSQLCKRYAALIIENVQVGESPVWLKQRLTAAGMRPISNLVDITNYVMLELGQPLHAFDFDTLAGKEIIVRRAKQGEKILTLDNVERVLDEDMLVIADRDVPVAIAGVMGGLATEVTESTKRILMESAHFDGTSIRKTSKKLGLRSEASQRFEKGVNAANLVSVLGRVAELVEQLGVGTPVGPIADNYPEPIIPIDLELRTSKVNQILGLTLSDAEIEQVLAPLGFELNWLEPDKLQINIPTYRADLTSEVDLIEEVARLYGFDKIPTSLPSGNTTLGKRTAEQELKNKARKALVNSGFSEVLTYSFTGARALDRIGLAADHPWREQIRIFNPLRDELSLMRTTLVPGLLETAGKNIARRNLDIAIFEQGYVYLPKDEQINSLPNEVYKISGLVSGNQLKTWNQPQVAMDFYYLKGALEYLFQQLGVKNYSLIPNRELSFMHPGRTASVIIRGKTAGFIGEVHPDVMEEYRLPARTCIFELDGAQLFAASDLKLKMAPVPRFPAITRDMALLVDEEVPIEKVYRAIRKAEKNLLRDVRLFDLYQGAQVPAGKKSVAFSLVYQSAERTLTDEEVIKLHDSIKKVLDQEFGAELRK